MKIIAQEADENPELLHNAPHNTLDRRLEEVKSAKTPILKYKDLLK